MIKSKKRKKALIIAAVLIAFAAAALYRGPITRSYQVQSDKIQNQITIAVIADLHSQYFGDEQEQIIRRLEKAKPDIILMPGDMANSPYSVDAMTCLITQAVKIAPCYYVTGNHEIWSSEADKICDIISSLGVTVLRGEEQTLNVNGNTIEIFGIDDPDADYYDDDYLNYTWPQRLDGLWTDNTQNNFRILMSHRPERADYYNLYEYDLIVAGHSHGGLVRIPFVLNGLYAPNAGFFPKYAGGEYALSGATTMIVSRGLYNYKYMPRVFNPSEVVIITIS